MYLHLPIEQLVRREGMPFQFAFATEAKDLLPEGEESLLNASQKGLHVLARNEEALGTPLEALREVYGPRLRVEAPRVRLIGAYRCPGADHARAHQPLARVTDA